MNMSSTFSTPMHITFLSIFRIIMHKIHSLLLFIVLIIIFAYMPLNVHVFSLYMLEPLSCFNKLIAN